MQTFYVTKNVTTVGRIEEVQGIVTTTDVLTIYRQRDIGEQPVVVGTIHGEGRDWHRTYEAAARRASAMRDYKIASHKAKLAKLEALTF